MSSRLQNGLLERPPTTDPPSFVNNLSNNNTNSNHQNQNNNQKENGLHGNGSIGRRSSLNSNSNGHFHNNYSNSNGNSNNTSKINGNHPPSQNNYNNNINNKNSSNNSPPLNNINNNLLFKRSSISWDQNKGFEESSKFIFILVTLSSALGMAAIGIVSVQDWIAFLTISAQLGAIALAVLAVYYHKAIYIVYKTLPRDLLGGWRYLKVLFNVGRAQRNNSTVHKIFSQSAKRHPNKVCFYFENQKWTFKEVEEMSNRVGNYFSSVGLVKGDSVSLFMENRPEYVCIWLGLSKIGVITALINFNLRFQPLKHSISVAHSKLVVFGVELTSAVKEMLELGGLEKMPFYGMKGFDGLVEKEKLPNWIDLDAGLATASTLPPIPSEPINFNDKLLYIYTSGTTGLPKAAVIKHSRYIMAGEAGNKMPNLADNEIIYSPIPLYHTAVLDGLPQIQLYGGMLGVGQVLIHGCSTVIRHKFSASSYWQDCLRYKCTAAQYIGEICRYLLCQPSSPFDTQHNIRLMFGNGLRPQVWDEFQSRFNIKRISEFYGATEGNCNIINIDNRSGSVGFISRIMPFIYPVSLIKIDEITGEPIRDPRSGLVLKCRPNEPGELVGKIVENHPVREFQGYADKTATTKKIVRDVFRKGDAAFRTGDILVMDDFGYFFFKDRTGDTYRWKGENVSTSEVEAVVSNVCGLKDAVVYGVEVPGSEGKAGMAAILDPDDSIDMDKFSGGVAKALASYARPLFIRIVKQMDMTGTYKMKKYDLQKEGFNINQFKEKVYLYLRGKYTLVDNEIYNNIMSGQLRL